MATVDIGMPVYNGGRHVGDAIRSLLDQTEADIRILVADDGSTDDTVEICKRFAAHDPRIELVGDRAHRGMIGNFQYVVDQATAPYFMWAAQDDLYDASFVEAGLKALSHSSVAVGAMSAYHAATPEGVRASRHDVPDGLSDPDPVKRARAVSGPAVQAMYALFRREPLVSYMTLADTYAPDDVLVFALALHAPLLSIHDPLLTKRFIGYDLVNYEGRVVMRKATGPDGHLYTPGAGGYVRTIMGVVRDAPLGPIDTVRAFALALRSRWWPIFRGSRLANSRTQIRQAVSRRRYLRAGLLALRHVVLNPGVVGKVLMHRPPEPT